MDREELHRLLGRCELEGFAQCHYDELYAMLTLIQRLAAIKHVWCMLTGDSRSVRLLSQLRLINAHSAVLRMKFHLLTPIRYLFIRELARAFFYDPGSVSGPGRVFDFEAFVCILLRGDS